MFDLNLLAKVDNLSTIDKIIDKADPTFSFNAIIILLFGAIFCIFLYALWKAKDYIVTKWKERRNPEKKIAKIKSKLIKTEAKVERITFQLEELENEAD